MPKDTNVKANGRTERTKFEEIAADDQLSSLDAAVDCFKAYAKERPEVVALWVFGIGFVLGWKLKPW